MATKNLSWLRTQLARLLNFDPDSPDAAWIGPEDYPWALIDGYAQEAYEQIVLDAVNAVGRPELFTTHEDVTWASGEVTFDLPSWLDHTSIIEVRDVTNDEVGEVLFIRPPGVGNSSSVWWKSPGVLQWGAYGPGSSKTLRIFFVLPNDLEDDELAEPTLIPGRFRQLWKWEAAVIARVVKDEDTIPQSWIVQRDKWRQQFHHWLMQGSPSSPVGATIESLDNTILY